MYQNTEIDINNAIEQIFLSGNHPGTVVTGFNPRLLNRIGGVYNHNYYDYEGTILLQECDDDLIECYSVVDPETNEYLGTLGYRQLKFDDSDNEICELYVNW